MTSTSWYCCLYLSTRSEHISTSAHCIEIQVMIERYYTDRIRPATSACCPFSPVVTSSVKKVLFSEKNLTTSQIYLVTLCGIMTPTLEWKPMILFISLENNEWHCSHHLLEANDISLN